MAVPIYTDYNPLPDNFVTGTYNESPRDQYMRTQPDTGETKVRRRYTKDISVISGTLRMLKTELANFDSLYQASQLEGHQFSWKHPRTGSTPTVFRFIRPPEYTHTEGDWWEVSIEMETV